MAGAPWKPGAHGKRRFKSRKALLFVNKKKQKNLPVCAVASPRANGQKFFGSFFQKRTRFLA
jgi:hypothetical protein